MIAAYLMPCRIDGNMHRNNNNNFDAVFYGTPYVRQKTFVVEAVGEMTSDNKNISFEIFMSRRLLLCVFTFECGKQKVIRFSGKLKMNAQCA